MAEDPKKKQDGSPKGGPAELIAQVFDRDRCAVCGACVGRCPYFVHERGRVVVRDVCTLERGDCLSFCPMAGARGDFEGDLGSYLSIHVARAAKSEFRKKAQYGGVVSCLTWTALKTGLIGEAVLTTGHPEEPPRGLRVKTKAQVLASAGSRYAASGAAAALNQALQEPQGPALGLVGTPCQIKAAAAMRSAVRPETSFDPARIRLLIGLFCTWALDYRRLNSYLRFMLMGERPFGYDIPPPPADVFMVRTGDGLKAFPLDEIRPMSLNACRFCDDMTSTRADLSVGAVEGLEGWNTLIVRTELGRDLVEKARSDNTLLIDDLPADDLEHLREAALAKKERSVINWTKGGKGK